MLGIDGNSAAEGSCDAAPAGGAMPSVRAVAVTAAPPAIDAFVANLRTRFDLCLTDLCLAIARVPRQISHSKVMGT
jgi:hypothetical protein